MIKKGYMLFSDGDALAVDENAPPTTKRALPLCYHLFGRAEPEIDKPVDTLQKCDSDRSD